eukprot:5095395-Pleurochrysis_carterae.AAC.1
MFLGDGHGEADRACDLAPRSQKRDNAISAYRCKHDVIGVHEGCVHACFICSQLQLSSAKPGKNSAIGFPDIVAKLATQERKENDAEALGVVRGA